MSLAEVKSLIENVIPIHIYLDDSFVKTILSNEDTEFDNATIKSIDINHFKTLKIIINE